MLLLLLVIAGCERRWHGKPVIELRFWNGFAGPDGRTMLDIVKHFNEANPDIHVVMQRMDWGTYYNKLFVAGLGGRAPEVFVIHADTLPRFAEANFVHPMDDLVGPAQIDVKDIDPNVWRAVDLRGKHWGIPLDVHVVGMFYNKKLFREAGIVDAGGNPRPPTNRLEFMDDLRKLSKPPRQFGVVFPWQRIVCYALMRQNEGDILSADGSRAVLGSPQNVQTMKFCQDLVKEHLSPSPENFDTWIGFLQGRVGIAFHGIFMLSDVLRQKDLDCGYAPLPMLFKQPATWANSHTLCLRADLKGDELKAGERLIKYISDHSLEWAAAGQIPVRRSLRNSAAFAKMTAQVEFAKQIPYAQYLPRVPYIFEYESEFDYAIERCLDGVDAQQALDEGSAKIQKVIDRYPPDLRRRP